MKKYELLLILPGTLDEKQAETRATEIVAMVKDHGKEVELTTIGKNRLAYPIKQIRYGYFYTVVFTAESEPLKALETKLSLLRDVLRTMVTNFNIALTPTQKMAYSAEATMMNREPAADKAMSDKLAMDMPVVAEATAETAAPAKKATAPAASVPFSKVKPDPMAMEEITKKLDEILSGDNIIPGV